MTPRAAELRAATAAVFPRRRFVVALSGGPDSAVVAWLSTQLDPPARPRAVFVQHGWRHSAGMERAARAVAASLELPLEVIAVEPTTTEGEARQVRLTAIEEAAKGDPIVTGHHGGDVAETALLNMARGAGAAGLGIPQRRGGYVRPLLASDAAAVRRVADDLGLPYADDPANVEDRPRNQVRDDILPRLAALVPGALAGIRRSAELAAADDAVLESVAASVPLVRAEGAISFPAAAVRALPAPVTSRVVRRVLRQMRPPYAGDRRAVDAVMGAVDGVSTDLGGGLRAAREGPLITVYDATARSPLEGPVRLVAGTRVTFGGHTLHAEVVAAPRVHVRGRHVAIVDAGLSGDLEVRAADVGEHVHIGTGSKLVSDAFNEVAVPPRLRATWPVVAAHGKIVWIAGVRSAVWSRPHADAVRVLQLTTERR